MPGGIHRVAFPKPAFETELTFYISRAYDTTALTRRTNPATYAPKFSVHMIVKHNTHMFPSLESMLPFLRLIQNHERWEDVEQLVDMSVYKQKQLFRVPGATKSPSFTQETRTFDLAMKQNILLPVNPITGVCEVTLTKNGCKEPSIPLPLWMAHLVCTPARRCPMQALQGVALFSP